MSNRLLAALSPSSRAQILSTCSLRDLPVGSFLYYPEEPTKFAYFLTSGMASVVLPTAEGGSAEVVLMGNEGLTGSMQLLGPACTPTCCFVQIAATAYRMRHDDLQQLFFQSEEIRSRVLELIQLEIFTLSQVAGCNRLHPAEARLARSLLMAQDRTHAPKLDLTQEFLAQMLGLQRTTVSTVAASLHEMNLIEYSRGRVTILDRPGLENSACSCYAATKRLLEKLYGRPWHL